MKTPQRLTLRGFCVRWKRKALTSPIMDFEAIRARMQAIYERHAARYDAERVKIGVEYAWLARFEALLAPGAGILDLGCGAGEPVSAYFIERGYALTGLDYAAPMIDIARSKYPQAHWIVGDMRALDIGVRFGGILSWHGFFHLAPDEQRDMLARIAGHVAPGGPVMLTVGPEAGEVIGHVAGEPVYHASLSAQDYADRLDALGLDLVEFRPDDPLSDHASVLLARRR